MSTLVRWVLAATLAALLVGCDAKDNDQKRLQAEFDPTPDSGDLVFVHAMVDAPQLEVAFAGSNGGSDRFELGYGQARQEGLLVGGYNVQITYENASGNTVTLYERLSDDNIKLFTDDEVTVVIAGTLASPRIFLVENTEYLYGSANPDNVQERPQIQFVHAVSGRGRLDFYLTGNADDLAGATPVTLAFGAVSALQDIDAGSGYRVRVTPAGNADSVLYDSGSTTFNTNTRAMLAAFSYFGPADAQLRLKRIRRSATPFANEPYPAFYRVAHLVADVADADLYFGPTSGVPVLAAQPFRALSAYQQRSRGTFTANLTVAGSPADVLFSDSLRLQGADATSIFFAGLQSDPDSNGDRNVVGIAAVENIRPIPGYAQIRAVHAALSGVPVDVYLLRPGQTAGDQDPAFALLDFGTTGARALGSGDYDLLVRNASGNALIGPERISLDDTSSYVLLLSDTAGGGAPLEWSLVPGPATGI